MIIVDYSQFILSDSMFPSGNNWFCNVTLRNLLSMNFNTVTRKNTFPC